MRRARIFRRTGTYIRRKRIYIRHITIRRARIYIRREGIYTAYIYNARRNMQMHFPPR